LQLHRNYPNKALKHFAHAVHIEPFNSKLLSAYAAVLDDLGMPLNVVERMYIRALQQVRTLTLFVSRCIY
jgi:Flp pilus assembly protein TadD